MSEWGQNNTINQTVPMGGSCVFKMFSGARLAAPCAALMAECLRMSGAAVIPLVRSDLTLHAPLVSADVPPD